MSGVRPIIKRDHKGLPICGVCKKRWKNGYIDLFDYSHLNRLWRYVHVECMNNPPPPEPSYRKAVKYKPYAIETESLSTGKPMLVCDFCQGPLADGHCCAHVAANGR